jgi:hypothetical protein
MLNARLYFIICLMVLGGLSIGGIVWNEEFRTIQYDSQEHVGYYILLKADHTMQVYQGEKDSFSGTWKNNNGKLFLNGAYFSYILTIQGNRLFDPSGEIWIQK